MSTPSSRCPRPTRPRASPEAAEEVLHLRFDIEASSLPGRVKQALRSLGDQRITAEGVVVTDTLPAGVTFVSASGGGTHSGGVVTWNVGALTVAAGQQSRTVTVTVGAWGLASTASRAPPGKG